MTQSLYIQTESYEIPRHYINIFNSIKLFKKILIKTKVEFTVKKIAHQQREKCERENVCYSML